MNSRFLQSLKIHPGEGARVALMFLYSLAAVGGGVVLGRAVSRSLFLSVLPETATPYKFILPPFFVIAAVIYYNRLVPRYPMYRLIAATNLLMVLGLFLFRYFLDSSFAHSFPFLASLYIYFEIVVTLIGIQYWTFAGEIFNPREAKRLFGLIATGGVLSNALAGIGLRAALSSISSKDLIFAVIVGLLIGVCCVWTLGKQKEQTAVSPSPSLTRRLDDKPVSIWNELREIMRDPMTVTLGALMIVTSLVANITDFQLDLSLQRFYAHDSQGMLAFLGTFQIYVGVAAVLVQFLLTNRVLERFGLMAGLLLLPLAIGGGSLAFLVAGGALWAMALPRGTDMTLRFTVNDASLNVLFLPIRESLRRRVKSTLDGVIKPPIMALLGLFFLLFLHRGNNQIGVQTGDVLPWSFVILVLVVIWVLLVLRTRKQYETALVDSLKGNRLAFEHTTFDIKDETTVKLIIRQLTEESSNPLGVIHTLEMLKPTEAMDWHPYILPLLEHPVPEARQLAARYFEEHAISIQADDALFALKRMFKDKHNDVRRAAILAYCALTGEAALEEIVPLLREADLTTRQAAIVGLMKYAGISGVMEAATTLKQMFEASDPVEREAGAAVLGSLQVKNYYQPLLPLLDDPDEAVQANAIRSAGVLRHPALIPKLIQKLGSPRHARYARAALVAFGPGIEHQLAVPLADSLHPAMQIAAAKVLREVHIPASAELLAKYFFDPNDHLRAAVAQALAHLQADGVRLGIKRSELLHAALAEIKRTYSMRLLRMDLGQDCGQALDRILRDHLVYILDHLFSVLSLLYPAQDMHAIHRVLISGGAQKANALELIDTLTDKEIKETLLPLVEAPIEKVVQIAKSRFGLERLSAEQRLNELTQSTDPILRAFAIQRLGITGTDSLMTVILQNMEYPHALVQESTVWAIAYGVDQKDIRPLLQRQLNSGFASVRNYAGRLLEEIS